MTRDDTMVIMNKLSRLFPTQSRKLSSQEWAVMAQTWQEQFVDSEFDDINRALMTYVKRGKPFLPDVADIINELINLDESRHNRLFRRLQKEAENVATGTEHVAIDDLGGLRRDPSSPTGWRYYPAEAHLTCTYTQADFAALPIEIQIYAEDIAGLRDLHREIQSNPQLARKRFIERMPYIMQEVEEYERVERGV